MKSKNSNKTFLSLVSAGILTSFIFLFFSIQSVGAVLTTQLDFGERGPEVTELQTFLAARPTIYPEGLVTGYFGPLTQAAVRRFQATNNIVSQGTPITTGYGRVGPRTMAAINAQMTGGGTGLDVNAPIISSIGLTTSSNSATLNWSTNESARGTVYYSTSPMSMMESQGNVVINGSTAMTDTSLRLVHSVMISGLQANTTYYYVIHTIDASGNVQITWPTTFRTQ
ncbi:MAG: fibronectin type III domain-containing protein [Parcubacteria group bacterium]